MSKIKIRSNPYTREISYYVYNELLNKWENIKEKNPNSKLREDESERAFLPFKIKEIVDIIISDYSVGKDPIEIVFEGTQDEYEELVSVCNEEGVIGKILVSRSDEYLENARFIRKEAREEFEAVQPIIAKIVRDDKHVIKDLNKVSDALKDIIPICVFGNYSSGKSTFINALIGSEILPSGGDPVTAKIYKISKSDQPDCARIRFEYLGEKFDISFEGESYRLLSGKPNNELMQQVTYAIDETQSLSSKVNAALCIINGFEKKDKSKIVLGNIIEIEIPFSKNGIIGQSDNRFVIFDTPGSNSASNIDHGEVLAEAMDGFSNGIPVWVSSYETLDTNDNAELCDKVMDIKALDKRFTMIVLNKADGSDLPEEGFSRRQIQDILEYTAVEKMYASGIYFVSSIMGLGSKNNGKLIDKHYRKTYRSQQEMYSDPEDMDYVTLYSFNIMPEQIKTKASSYSEECTNLIYANSGLLCVEMEMEAFASKYSAYNKCQMVYLFLNTVIGETNKRIEEKTTRLMRTKEARSRELDSAKQELIKTIEDQVSTSEREFEKASKVFIKNYVDEEIDYTHTHEEIDKFDEKFRSEHSEEHHFSDQEQDYEQSRANMWSRFKTNGQNLFKGNFIESLKCIKDDLVHDIKDVQETWEAKSSTSKQIDQETSDRLIRMVVTEYRKNMMKAKDTVSVVLRQYWQERSQELREILISIIAGTEALSESQREEISSIIYNYQPIEFDDDADNIFIKKKFLRGNIFGLSIGDSERINTKRLASIYNEKIKKNSKAISLDINASCYSSFKSWEQSLYAVIEANITEYNPALRDLADMIRDDTEKILELTENKEAISAALDAINEMMSWKETEQF